MLSRLIESGAGATARRQWLPSGLIAVAAHAVIDRGRRVGDARADAPPVPPFGLPPIERGGRTRHRRIPSCSEPPASKAAWCFRS